MESSRSFTLFYFIKELIHSPSHPPLSMAFQGVSSSPQSVLVLQVSWQDVLSSLPNLVQPLALTDDGLPTPLLFFQRFIKLLAEDSFSVFLVPLLPLERRRIPSVRLSFTLRFCSWLSMFIVALSFSSLLPFISPLL